ncbi:MAG: hypothetical protein R2774_10790 [Saprospiraceae bacterium]
MMRFLFLFVLCLHSEYPINAQSDSLVQESFLEKLQRFSLSGHGAMNYYHFQWQTDSVKRNAIDNERFVLDFGYKWNDNIRLKAEIEFEHGGTGVDVEFDRFEEFGEFEYEITKGGEVLLEQMHIEFLLRKHISLKVGRIKVPFAMMFIRDEPTDYNTAIVSEMEMQILPENWTENGISLKYSMGVRSQWQLYLALINGLDNSAFNSANWIKRGNQRRFEMVNAENFALSARLDYQMTPSFTLGLSLYGSNTTSSNRPKPDLKVATPIGLGEFHVRLQSAFLQCTGMFMYGVLGNSEILSNQNRNLSNNLNVKRTPVGAAAVGGYIEAALNLTGQKGMFPKLYHKDWLFFTRYDYYDTQFETQGLIFNNPRWARQTWTLGSVYKIIDDVHLKFQYSDRIVGAPAPTSVNGGRHERTFIGGFAFAF